MLSDTQSHFEHLTHKSTHKFLHYHQTLVPHLMDFHSLTRKELQSLCKLNKIPANLTNVAMADALQSLKIVNGVEEFLNVPQPETDGMVKSMEEVEVFSPKVPNTRCRTTTRSKVKNGEAENLLPTATRTTRRGSKQLGGGVEESNNNVLVTPALSSTRRKALAASSCRNVNSQLNDCQEEAKKEGLVDQELEHIPSSPAVVVRNSCRRDATASTHGATVRKESTMAKTYSTRRSTRQTEKKSTEPRARKGSEKAVKMDSFLDEVNATSKEAGKPVEVSDDSIGSGKPNAQLEEICNAFEKLDVLIEENAHNSMLPKAVNIEEQTGADESSNPCEEGDFEEKAERFDLGEKVFSSEAKNVEVDDQKTELDNNNSSSYENENSEQKSDAIEVSSKDNLNSVTEHNLVMVSDEDCDRLLQDNSSLESGKPNAEMEDICNASENCDVLIEESAHSSVLEKAVNIEATHRSGEELDNLKPGLDESSNLCADGDLEEKLKIGETFDLGEYVSPQKNNEVYDHKVELDDNTSSCEKEKFDAAEVGSKDYLSAIKDHNLVTLPEEDRDRLLHDNANLKSGVAGADDMNVDPIPFETETLNGSPELGPDSMIYAVSEMKDQVSESNGCSSMVMHMDLCYTENPSEALKWDDENNFITADEISTKDMVDESIDNIFTMTGEVEELKPQLFTESSMMVDNISTKTREVEDVESFVKVPQNHPCISDPMKKSFWSVSDDKENIESGRKVEIVIVGEEKKSKDDDRNLNEISIRQLRKQVKALTLKNMKVEQEATKRPALQALCDNQLVGGETKN